MKTSNIMYINIIIILSIIYHKSEGSCIKRITDSTTTEIADTTINLFQNNKIVTNRALKPLTTTILIFNALSSTTAPNSNQNQIIPNSINLLIQGN